MKNSYFAALLAVSTLILGGCAGTPQRQTIMVPVQQTQRVTPPQELCPGRGWVDIGTCNRSSGMQIPVGQIMQAGSGLGTCEVVGGVGGAVGGALIGGKDHRGLGAILGAVVGAFAGNKYCESEQQAVPVATENRCRDGKVWAKLAWSGHPQDGNMVCLDQNDPHRADGNSTQPQKVARAESSRCKDGKVWAKLAWPGHPQDGNMVCMMSDDVHRGN